MMQTLRELCDLCAVSGNEGAVRDALLNQLKNIQNITVTVDPLGSLIVEKHGRPAAKKLMLTAHMDEVGMIVTYHHGDGALQLAPVGGVEASAVLGRQVLAGEAHIPGVIGAKPVHLLKDSELKQQPKWTELTLDIGAQNADEAKALLPLGSPVYFAPDFRTLGSHRVTSKAIDDRIGCALLLTLLKSDFPYSYTVAFLVQEEVGLRGAAPAAYRVKPDCALVLEATTAADLPDAQDEKAVCRLGGGAVISFMDRSTIYDRRLYQLAAGICEKEGLPWQTKTRIAGGNDSGAIHKSIGGIPTLAVSLPCRYLHSPSCLADTRDMQTMQTLLPLLAEQMMQA